MRRHFDHRGMFWGGLRNATRQGAGLYPYNNNAAGGGSESGYDVTNDRWHLNTVGGAERPNPTLEHATCLAPETSGSIEILVPQHQAGILLLWAGVANLGLQIALYRDSQATLPTHTEWPWLCLSSSNKRYFQLCLDYDRRYFRLYSSTHSTYTYQWVSYVVGPRIA